MDTDRIEKSILLRAPRTRVWQALADSQKFGEWFGVKMLGEFAPGARLKGKILHKGYENAQFVLTIEQIEPERMLSWRWHPNAHDPHADYSAEPTTLVAFDLKDAPDGTLLTVVESGFDSIPVERRLEAYRSNTQGWEIQVQAINTYVTQAA